MPLYLDSGCGQAPDAAAPCRARSTHLDRPACATWCVFGAGIEHGHGRVVAALLRRRIRTHVVLDAAGAGDDVRRTVDRRGMEAPRRRRRITVETLDSCAASLTAREIDTLGTPPPIVPRCQRIPSFKAMMNEVVAYGSCCECGSCVLVCPHNVIDYVDGKPKQVAKSDGGLRLLRHQRGHRLRRLRPGLPASWIPRVRARRSPARGSPAVTRAPSASIAASSRRAARPRRSWSAARTAAS